SRLLPTGHQGSVLLTTRAQHIEPFAQTQLMGFMPEAEAELVLLHRSKLTVPAADLHQATDARSMQPRLLYELLSALAVALDQAGVYIVETGCSFSAYRERYEIRRATLLGRRGWRFVGHEESVATTLSLIAEKVGVRSPLATQLLRVCAFLESDA